MLRSSPRGLGMIRRAVDQGMEAITIILLKLKQLQLLLQRVREEATLLRTKHPLSLRIS
jgi:hypothetical protein